MSTCTMKIPNKIDIEPSPSCDVVVVGGGVGGLCAAGFLAKAGLSVQVFETRQRLGGCLVGFDRGAYCFDTAIHWLNFFGAGGVVRHLLEHLGGPFPPTAAPRVLRRYVYGDSEYRLTCEPDVLKERLIGDFPHRRHGLEAFFDAARRVGAAFAFFGNRMRAPSTMGLGRKIATGARVGLKARPLWKYSGIKAEDGLERVFETPELGRLFPSEEQLISCLMPVGWAYSGNYQLPPSGGSRRIVDFLSKALDDYGARVFTQSPVTRVERAGGCLEVTASGPAGQKATVRSRYVVYAADLFRLYDEILPQTGAVKKRRDALKKADIYDSAVTVSLGLDAPAESFGFDDGLVLLADPGHERAAYRSGDPKSSVLSVFAPSVADPSLCAPGKGTLTIFAQAGIDVAERWHTGDGLKRASSYRDHKQAFADILIDRVEKRLAPGLRGHLDVLDVATPVTYERYTGNTGGTMMGQRPTKKNIYARVAGYNGPLENLFIAGHWAEYGGGIPAVVRAGANVGALILKKENRAAFDDLVLALAGP